MNKAEYNNGYPTDTITFTIKTSHGEYLHQASVDIPPEIRCIEALELVQQASPYTESFKFDPTNENHVTVLSHLTLARLNPKVNPYRYGADYGDGWFPGHSWTWIRVRV